MKIESEDFDEIKSYDIECFGFDRAKFLKNWLTLPDRQSFKYLENNALKGFAVIRKVNIGFKIGPLFADNDAIAEELYRACLNSAIGEPIYFDIPTVNKGAIQIVKKYNAQYTFECARMYYGNAPKINMNKVYGITSFELG